MAADYGFDISLPAKNAKEAITIMKFDEILRNMHTEGIIGGGLIIALFLAIYFNDRDLAVNIASGLIGYLGRGKVSS